MKKPERCQSCGRLCHPAYAPDLCGPCYQQSHEVWDMDEAYWKSVKEECDRDIAWMDFNEGLDEDMVRRSKS